jgi:hypothetical protein
MAQELFLAKELYLLVCSASLVFQQLLMNGIYRPGLLHSLAGMISTIANIYGAQRGIFTQTSKATLFVTVTGVGICGLMCLLYRFILIRRLKKQHEKQVGEQHGGKYGEASQV